MNSTFFQMVPCDFKDGDNLFNWFNVTLNVNRTSIRVMEGTVTVGADFEWFTQVVCPSLIRNQRRESCDGAEITRFFRVFSLLGQPLLRGRFLSVFFFQ
jgi:hypothetical protein